MYQNLHGRQFCKIITNFMIKFVDRRDFSCDCIVCVYKGNGCIYVLALNSSSVAH